MESGAKCDHHHVTFEDTDQQDADLRVPLRSVPGGVRSTGSEEGGAQLSILRKHGSRTVVLPPDGPVVIDPRTEHEGGEEAREGPGDGADDRPARIRAGPRRLAFVRAAGRTRGEPAPRCDPAGAGGRSAGLSERDRSLPGAPSIARAASGALSGYGPVSHRASAFSGSASSSTEAYQFASQPVSGSPMNNIRFRG